MQDKQPRLYRCAWGRRNDLGVRTGSNTPHANPAVEQSNQAKRATGINREEMKSKRHLTPDRD